MNIGYKWLAEMYGVEPVQAFRVESKIGKSRSTRQENGFTYETYLPLVRPKDNLAGHLTFALKHEGVHLEFLARLFVVLPKEQLENWIYSEPTGQYARRAGFFYEWLTGKMLKFSGVTKGSYVNALDEKRYLTALKTHNNVRWRVRDNLPGTPAFCPLVLRTENVHSIESYDCAAHLRGLEAEYGADLLLRSAVWLTIKESRASFAIEHEEKKVDRIRRFAGVMERRCGYYESALNESALNELQREILGDIATRYGLRASPVFVGEMDSWVQMVHYIAPAWEQISSMLSGLEAFIERTRGQSAILRAAVLSFGFIYIHPMSDGNGRISRFLVNDVLRRDKAVPEPFILPISATITSSSVNRKGYDQVLELVSKPFMRRYRQDYRFGPEKIAQDGVRYNLEFDAYDDAAFTWRYLDLTDHVEYLGNVIHLTIEHEMRKEAGYLRSLRLAREQVKAVLEGPDADIDRIIRSVRENGGKISNKLKQELPLLNNADLSRAVVFAVENAFKN